MDTHSTGRALLVALLGFLGTSAADAQILRVPEKADAERSPYYFAFAVGLLQSQDRYDGVDGDLWRLGDGVNYRFSIEKGIRAGAIGVTANNATLSLARASRPGSGGEVQLRD